MIKIVIFLVLWLPSSLAYSSAPKCLLVTSYHEGYSWQDGIVDAIFEILQSECEIKYFQMDTKRNKKESHAKEQAALAYKIVEQWKPDVVIATDDNASKYFVVPYMKNHDRTYALSASLKFDIG